MNNPKLFLIGGRSSALAIFCPEEVRTVTLREKRANVLPIRPGASDVRTLYPLNRWPDVFSCSGYSIVVEDRIGRAILAAGFGPLDCFPIRVVDICGGAIARKPQPKYMGLRPKHHLKIEHDYDDNSPNAVLTRAEPAEPPPPGIDFFLDEGLIRNSVMCSLRVVEFIRQMKWKDFAVWPADLPRSWQRKEAWRNGVNIFGRKWPPQWYPPGLGPSKFNQ